MKIIIFGATGSLGQQLVINALNEGHEVTAFSRHPEKLQQSNEKLNKLAGDVFSLTAVKAAVAGHDAVIIALGAGIFGKVREVGTDNVIKAMKAHGLDRLIVLSTMGAGDSRRYLNFFWKYLMFGLLLRQAMADHERQEAIVRSSGLNWTIVRPAAFTDDPATGKYKHGNQLINIPLTLKLPKADVAEFMLSQLTDTNYIHQAPMISL